MHHQLMVDMATERQRAAYAALPTSRDGFGDQRRQGQGNWIEHTGDGSAVSRYGISDTGQEEFLLCLMAL